MFAFAIWDVKRRELFLARDRLGIKPLYYRLTDHELVFGSEIKAILAYTGVRVDMETDKLPEYLAFGYFGGSGTLFRGIAKLPPGHTLLVSDRGDLDTKQYWDLSFEQDGASHDQKH